jgi:hypothetical protein
MYVNVLWYKYCYMNVNKKFYSIEEIKNAISCTHTMGGAAKYLNIDWRTFKREAVKYGLYSPSISGRERFPLNDILDGKHPHYATCHLRKRLLKEGVKAYVCESCKNTEWMNSPIPLECHHKNGNNADHTLDNLQLLCPNCHAMTDTYRSKNISKRRGG